MQPGYAIPQTLQRIVLVGFMGAGKSTVGPILAERLGWRFVDTDHCLEARTGTTIADIFTKVGETAFRVMESEIAAELLQERELVLSLGGGAVETESTRTLLNQSDGACVVFLKASFDVLIDRCEQQPDAAVRPVLRQRHALSRRFHSRLPHYERAHITVDTEGLRPEKVVDRILHLLVENACALSSTLKAIAT